MAGQPLPQGSPRTHQLQSQPSGCVLPPKHLPQSCTCSGVLSVVMGLGGPFCKDSREPS